MTTSAASRTAVVTGANSGLGKETVKELIKAGYDKVVMACRNVETGADTRREIAEEVGGAEKMTVSPINLSSLDSIRDFAGGIEQCDLLVNNAGVMLIPDLRRTEDGFEEHWGVNYISHYLLTSQLMEKLQRSPSARIVNISSAANSFGKIDLSDMDYTKNYDSWLAYSNSKLGNLMFTFELHKRLRASGIENVSVNAVHPGLVKTNLGRYMNPAVTSVFMLLPEFFVLSPAAGARTQVDVALSAELEGKSGKYYADQTFKFQPGTYAEETVVVSPLARDENLSKSLWEYSEKVTQSQWGF